MDANNTTNANQASLSEADKTMIKAALAGLMANSGTLGLKKNAEDLVEAFRVVNES
ncbi:hypothetical protein [Laribacter hongkongensis]|uniref:hypothetical protein n=1 Tax=Laribacter hongkongensis TaxID=168471 RepID=UPI001EFE25E3|nr:hypothetical protein [Laribacter hongkongensis]MCG9094439.1 hypothetical protein [Laribacter hongkongensis]